MGCPTVSLPELLASPAVSARGRPALSLARGVDPRLLAAEADDFLSCFSLSIDRPLGVWGAGEPLVAL